MHRYWVRLNRFISNYKNIIIWHAGPIFTCHLHTFLLLTVCIYLYSGRQCFELVHCCGCWAFWGIPMSYVFK